MARSATVICMARLAVGKGRLVVLYLFRNVSASAQYPRSAARLYIGLVVIELVAVRKVGDSNSGGLMYGRELVAAGEGCAREREGRQWLRWSD
ncbi:hypothetical protein F4775DRAFT_563016, partial [Biscogniauxia sp. FL1348]